jgi:serine protease
MSPSRLWGTFSGGRFGLGKWGCVAAAVAALVVAPAGTAGRTAAPGVPRWQWTATHSDAVPAWVHEAARNVTIAVVDTGADLLTPSLAGRSAATWNVTTSTPTVQDTVGHGTFVASLAAGFGGEARLMIVQANRGDTLFSDIDEADAIVYAVDHGANIINLSLGGPQTSFIERNAIDYATEHGVLLVAAAGNAGDEGNPTIYPAALIGRSGLVVGASTPAGTRASFSTTGRYVDVLAPGVGVLGALATGVSTSYFTPSGVSGLGFGTGTSYAAPEVAGAAALVWAARPTLTAQDVAAVIETTASNQGLWTKELAFGTVDVGAAVQLAASGAAVVAPSPAVAPEPLLLKPKAKARSAAKKTKSRGRR